MDEEASKPARLKLTRWGWIWLGTTGLMAACGWMLQRLDHVTELTPDHSDALEFGGFAGAGMALISVLVTLWQTRGRLVARIAFALTFAPLVAFLGTFMLLAELSALA